MWPFGIPLDGDICVEDTTDDDDDEVDVDDDEEAEDVVVRDAKNDDCDVDDDGDDDDDDKKDEGVFAFLVKFNACTWTKFSIESFILVILSRFSALHCCKASVRQLFTLR